MPAGRPAMSERAIVTINGGSSSIKFAVFDCTGGDEPTRRLEGQIERIGSGGTRLVVGDETRPIDAADHAQAADRLIDFLHQRLGATSIAAVGHRVVHGGFHLTEHQLVTDELIAELKRTQPLDLAHLPREIALIESFHHRFPKLPQLACFDTAFHRNRPRVSDCFPIPADLLDDNFRRWGTQGLSFEAVA